MLAIFLDAILKFLVIYLIGSAVFFVLCRNMLRNGYVTLFAKLFLGIVTIATGFALYYTRGATILWGLAILLVGSFFFSKTEYTQFKKGARGELHPFLMGLLALLTIIMIQLFRNGFFLDDIVYLSDIDFGIYATVAEYLKIAGVETPSPWYELIEGCSEQLPMPYHYGDLWFASFVTSWGMPLQPLEHFVYVFIPLLGVTLFTAYMALIQNYLGDQNLWLWVVGAFLLLFYHAWFPWLPGATGGLYVTTVLAPKVFFFQAGIMAFFLLWLRGQLLLALFVLAAIPLLNVLFLPAVTGASTIFFVYSFFSKKERNWRGLLLYLIPLIALAFIALFYVFFGSLKAGLNPSDMPLRVYFYRLFRGLASGFLRFSVFEALVVGLLVLCIKNWAILSRQERDLVIWQIGIWGGALLAKAVFNKASAEVDQFFYLVANPLAAGSILLSGLVLFTKKKSAGYSIPGWLILAAYLVLFIPFIQVLLSFQQRDNAVSVPFLETLNNTLQGKNKLGVFISNPEKMDTYRADPRMCTFCNFLKLSGKGYWSNNIMVPVDTVGLPFPDRLNAIMMSPFFRYANMVGKQARGNDLASLQLSYIRDNEVDFIIVEEGTALPEYLAACVSRILRDSISGHKVYILDRPCESY